jgi:hypothetical protein
MRNHEKAAQPARDQLRAEPRAGPCQAATDQRILDDDTTFCCVINVMKASGAVLWAINGGRLVELHRGWAVFGNGR